MKSWQCDLLSLPSSAETEQALFERLKAEARKLGFEHCAYGLRLPLHFTQPKTVMFNTYPANWQTRYVAENYIAVDPTVRHCALTQLPLLWADHVFEGVPEFWEEARAHGLQYGWSQAGVSAQNIRGMFTLARSDDKLSETELRDKGQSMVWLAQIAHHCMSERVAARLLPEAAVKLSGREKEVLQWTAEGKTSAEISDIMNISERTVNFHIVKTMEKLNCANKTAATVQAALLGLLN